MSLRGRSIRSCLVRMRCRATYHSLRHPNVDWFKDVATTEFNMRSKRIDGDTLLSVPYRHENPAYAAKLSFAERNAQRLPIDGLNTMRLSISKST